MRFMKNFLKMLGLTIIILAIGPGLLMYVPYLLITTAGTVGIVLSCIIWLSAFCAGGAHLMDEDNTYMPPVLYMNRRKK